MYFEMGHQATGDPNYRSNHNRLAFHNGIFNIRDIVECQIYVEEKGVQESLSLDTLKYKRGRVLVAGKYLLSSCTSRSNQG